MSTRRGPQLMLTLGLVLGVGALGWVLFVMPGPAPHRAPWARAAQGAAPPAATSRLVVSASPWAELYVDGRLVGNTPVIDLPVTAGKHTLRLVRQGFVPDERVVTVTEGETLRVTGIRLRGGGARR